ncbi:MULTISPECIES: Fur family transcriptional regulator [Cupriavidus]|uniref:Fur family transcriptional regulator n=1 Tax=Cupriavidus TaxID=106589 RepID=UPI000374AFBF|nr:MULTISPECIES: Fur family transcriptional regulator [Cupriavidus]
MSASESVLRDAGLRPTLLRLQVLGALQRCAHAHPTAEALYVALRDAGNQVGIGTVYRVLGDMENAGIVRRSQLGHGKSFYELSDGSRHVHVVSMQDGKIFKFEDEALLERLDRFVAEKGYRIVDLQLTVYVQPA